MLELKQVFADAKDKIKEIFKAMEETKINEDATYQNKDMIKEAELAKDKYFALKAKTKPAKKEEKKSEEKSEEYKSEETSEKDEDVNEDELWFKYSCDLFTSLSKI